MEKKLYKNNQNKMLCGVCSGLGDYLNLDPTIIRLLAVIIGCTGTGIILYIAAAVIIPDPPALP